MRRLLIIVFLLSCSYNTYSQNKDIDSFYISASGKAYELSKRSVIDNLPDDQTKQAHLDSAVAIFLKLDATYWMSCQDAGQFLEASYVAGNNNGLKRAAIRMMKLTGEPVKILFERYLSRQTPLKDKKLLDPAINWLYEKNDSLLAVARGAIDWPTVLVLWSSLVSEQEYRTKLPQEIFKDTTQLPGANTIIPNNATFPIGWTIGCRVLDSIHLYTLYHLILKNGFPGERKCGCYSSSMWLTMRHAQGLITGNMAKEYNHIEIFKYLWPLFFEHTKKGEFPANWYDYVYGTLIDAVIKYYDPATIAFFEQYRLNEYELNRIR